MTNNLKRLRSRATALWSASPPLALTGWLMIADFVLCLVAMCFDARQITGVDAWLKPAKFGISSAVTCLTLAWIAGYLKDWPRIRILGGRIFAASIAIEIVIIDLQAARGTTSHFNVSTSFDKGAFIVMGMSICTLWSAMAAMTYAIMRQTISPPSWKWAIRLGLSLSLIGAAGGGFMLRRTPEQKLTSPALAFGSHTVGAPDGGPGLPVANWSTQGGDLRLPHFLGLHAMQVIPMLGLWLLGRGRLSERQRTRFVWLVSGTYVAAFALLTWQALRGQSLIDPDWATLSAAFGVVLLAGAGATAVLISSARGAFLYWMRVFEVQQ